MPTSIRLYYGNVKMFRSVIPYGIVYPSDGGGGCGKCFRILCKGATLRNDTALISKHGHPQKLFQRGRQQRIDKGKSEILGEFCNFLGDSLIF